MLSPFFKKAWKVTMVVFKCNGATFLTSFQEGSHQNCSFKDFIQNSASKMANCIIVDIVNSLCY